jgi:hypothetical protein
MFIASHHVIAFLVVESFQDCRRQEHKSRRCENMTPLDAEPNLNEMDMYKVRKSVQFAKVGARRCPIDNTQIRSTNITRNPCRTRATRPKNLLRSSQQLSLAPLPPISPLLIHLPYSYITRTQLTPHDVNSQHDRPPSRQEARAPEESRGRRGDNFAGKQGRGREASEHEERG